MIRYLIKLDNSIPLDLGIKLKANKKKTERKNREKGATEEKNAETHVNIVWRGAGDSDIKWSDKRHSACPMDGATISECISSGLHGKEQKVS